MNIDESVIKIDMKKSGHMKKSSRIDGFAVEILPSTQRGKTYWTAWLQEHPSVQAQGDDYGDAMKALATKWDEIKAAYRQANVPVPTPIRSGGNKRIHDAIRKLGEREWTPIF